MGTGPSGAWAGDYAGFDKAIRNFECNVGSLGTAVILNAFDLVELDGQDWRLRSLEERKERLGRLPVKAPGRGAAAISPFIERP
jgi:ATP-dependent DNA ligase